MLIRELRSIYIFTRHRRGLEIIPMLTNASSPSEMTRGRFFNEDPPSPERERRLPAFLFRRRWSMWCSQGTRGRETTDEENEGDNRGE